MNEKIHSIPFLPIVLLFIQKNVIYSKNQSERRRMNEKIHRVPLLPFVLLFIQNRVREEE